MLGHSDADVLIHAVMDALLGARLLEISDSIFRIQIRHIRNIQPRLLDHVAGLLKKQGFSVGNIDAVIIAQKPKMAPYIPKMRQNIAQALGISADRVNIKATTEDKLGFTGREEGIASQAVCLLEEA